MLHELGIHGQEAFLEGVEDWNGGVREIAQEMLLPSQHNTHESLEGGQVVVSKERNERVRCRGQVLNLATDWGPIRQR